MIERVLLLVNRSSGTGHGENFVARLQDRLAESLGSRIAVQVEVVNDHAEARACTRAFLQASPTSAAIIVGGGGGTLRAVVEAICQGSSSGGLPGPERVRVAALRMGSGNVVAKQFGVPLDPIEGLLGIVQNIQADRTAPCCVMRCQVGLPQGEADVRHAVTMCGLGQFGRAPGDLARWHRRLPRLRRFLARLLGIEVLNNLEYALAIFLRSAWCALRPGASEVVEIRAKGRNESLRLLSGVVLNFPIKALPLDPGVRVEEAALSLHLIPFPGRFKSLWLALAPGRLARRVQPIRIEVGECVEIRFLDRDTVEFFLDEDPEQAYGRLTLQVAGTLAFVPGPGYRWLPQ